MKRGLEEWQASRDRRTEKEKKIPGRPKKKEGTYSWVKNECMNDCLVAQRNEALMAWWTVWLLRKMRPSRAVWALWVMEPCKTFVPHFWERQEEEDLLSLDAGFWEAAKGIDCFGRNEKQGRKHGYPSRVRVGRGHNWGHSTFGQEQWGQKPQKPKKSKKWWTDGWTNGRIDQWTDGPTKQGVESRSTQLKSFPHCIS